jgi:hypothetical protein
MMQLDGMFFCSICSESEGNVVAIVIQTRMNTNQQDKITSWNHIDRCKKKLQIGILLTDANMFASQLFLCLVGTAWQSISIEICRNLTTAFCGQATPKPKFYSRTRIRRWRVGRERLLCFRTVRIQASKSSSNCSVRENCK